MNETLEAVEKTSQHIKRKTEDVLFLMSIHLRLIIRSCAVYETHLTITTYTDAWLLASPINTRSDPPLKI